MKMRGCNDSYGSRRERMVIVRLVAAISDLSGQFIIGL